MFLGLSDLCWLLCVTQMGFGRTGIPPPQAQRISSVLQAGWELTDNFHPIPPPDTRIFLLGIHPPCQNTWKTWESRMSSHWEGMQCREVLQA